MTHRRPLFLLALLTALAGCGGNAPSAGSGVLDPGASGAGTPEASPTAPSSFSPYVQKLAANDATAGVSDAGIKLLGGSLTIEATDGTGPIAKAVVDVYGPTLATGVTDATGKASVGPLAPGASYTVVVHAPGFAAVKQAALEIKQKMTTTVRLSMVPGVTVAGRVTAAGAPVGGAVVSDGLNSAITDESGQYELTNVSPGAANLRASKPSFKAGVRAVTLSGTRVEGTDLELAPSGGSVFLDTRRSTKLGSDHFKTLKATLASAHWSLVDAPPPAPGDAWILVSPAGDLDAATVSAATAFVAQGGKLVILGEWGGFSGFDTRGANGLAHALGLHFNPDALREFEGGKPDAVLSLTHFEARSVGADGPKRVTVSNACSVFGLSGMRPLATTGPKAYHVQSGAFEARVVAIGGPVGAGKAIAIGDTSAFADDDTDGDGTPDAKGADNMRFLTRLLAW